MKHYRTLFLVALVTLFITGCEHKPTNKGLVEINGGRKMYMECHGTGSPTVVLIAGYKERGDFAWNTFLPNKPAPTVYAEVGKFTRVCLYDRPGTIFIKEDSFEKSRSDAVPQPITAATAATDLHALLVASHQRGPYVIVAHSAGGLIGRLYTSMYPKDVSGLVLVDVTTEDLKEKWTPEQWKIFEHSINFVSPDLATYKDLEKLDILGSFKQLQSADGIRALAVPAIVLTADKTPNAALLISEGLWPSTATPMLGKQIVAAVLDAQNDLANSFVPPAKHITHTNSGHNIHREQPQLVIDAVREVVDKVRTQEHN